MWRWTARTVVIFLLCMNLLYIVKTFVDRKYLIRDMNKTVATAAMSKDDTMIGAWAPAFSWETKARAVPVWKNYMNDRNVLQQFQPRMVAADDDVERLFAEEKISLKELSDSSRSLHFDILNGRTITVYWMMKTVR